MSHGCWTNNVDKIFLLNLLTQYQLLRSVRVHQTRQLIHKITRLCNVHYADLLYKM